MTDDGRCPLCGLRGKHTHRPHAVEIRGVVNDEPATLKLAGCIACCQPAQEIASANDPCPAFIGAAAQKGDE